MINSRFDAFTEQRGLPPLRELIPKRAARCMVKVDLLLIRAGVESITAPDGMISTTPTHVVGIESFEQKGYHEVFARALGRGAVATEYHEAVQTYIDNPEN